MPTILVTVDGAFQPVPSSTRLRAAVASEAPPNGTLLLGPTAIPECRPADRLFVDPLTGHRDSWFSRPDPLVECLRDIHATAKLIRSGPVRSALADGRDSIATRHPLSVLIVPSPFRTRSHLLKASYFGSSFGVVYSRRPPLVPPSVHRWPGPGKVQTRAHSGRFGVSKVLWSRLSALPRRRRGSGSPRDGVVSRET